jgi:phage-related protein
MNSKFEVLFLDEAREFLFELDVKTRAKILYNIDKSKILNDPTLFKKLSGEIWEFRTKYNGLQYRFLAFWDKTDKVETVVVSTHGFIKKVDKVSPTELDKAEQWRRLYFDQKKRKK